MVLTVCSLCGLGSIPSHGRVFKGFTMADQTQSTRPEQVWQEMAQSPLNGMKKNNGHRGGRPMSNQGQTIALTKTS